MCFFSIAINAQVNRVSNVKFSIIKNGETLKIPVYASHNLNTKDAKITRVAVFVHGLGRTAYSYYKSLDKALKKGNTQDSTLAIAPLWLTEKDLKPNKVDAEHLYWSSSWNIGHKSKNKASNPRPERISSYAVLDSLLLQVAQNLPNLRQIVLAGHSAGGQFMNRYAASSPMITTLTDMSIDVKIMPMNPSSWLYLDNKRLKKGTKNMFEVPSSRNSCDGKYNDYKYGLDDYNSYLKASGKKQIRQWYGEREIIHFVGDKDTGRKNLDIRCKAMLQGENRFERAKTYHRYLKNYYGSDNVGNLPLVIIPNISHSGRGIINSTKGLFHLLSYSGTFGQGALGINVDVDVSDNQTICEGDTVTLTLNQDNANYQWYKNKVAIRGALSKSYTVSKTGNYYALITKNGEKAQSIVTSIVVHTLSAPNVSNVGTNSGVVNLKAKGTGGILKWYKSANSSNALHTGASYLPKISATTSFFVEETKDIGLQTVKVGKVNADINSENYHKGNFGLVFNALSALKIKSVKVYAKGNKERKFILKDNAGNILQSKTVNVLNGENRVVLNFEVPVGKDYQLVVEKINGESADLFRGDNGFAYPYKVDGLVSITKSTTTSYPKLFYYYFYDWEVQNASNKCVSPRTEVVVNK